MIDAVAAWAERLGGSLGATAALVVGGALLLFGRRIYWLAAGVVGFVAVFVLTRRLAPELSEQALLLVAVVAGIAGAALAIFAHKVLLGLLGAAGGGMIALWQAQALGVDRGVGWLVAAVVGGLIGAWLLARLFELALIALSSLLGAQLVVDAAFVPPEWRLVTYVGLAAVGILVQATGARRKRRRQRDD